MLRKLVLLVVAAAVVSPVTAAAAGLELAPFLGYAVGTKLDTAPGGLETKLNDDWSYGLALDIPTGGPIQVELWYLHQGTDLQTDGSGLKLFDVDVDYYHVGVVQFWEYDNLEPYYVFSLGVTTISPEAGFESDTQPSAGFGGGLRLFVDRGARLGFRFEGRLLATYYGGDRGIFCSGSACLSQVRDSFLLQPVVTAGLTIRLR